MNARVWQALPGLHLIYTPLVSAFLLEDEQGFVLIDTGLIGVPRAVRRLVRDPSRLRAILLTHGHLDHTAGLAGLVDWSDAPVHAHAAEREHVAGTYPYRGIARTCGLVEAVGRIALGYRRVAIDANLTDDQLLPVWGGLRVVHLPGHTSGHCGFYSEARGLLFSGDLFAFRLGVPHLPPSIFNSAPRLLEPSLRRVDALAPVLICPSHRPPRMALDELARRYRRWRERRR